MPACVLGPGCIRDWFGKTDRTEGSDFKSFNRNKDRHVIRKTTGNQTQLPQIHQRSQTVSGRPIFDEYFSFQYATMEGSVSFKPKCTQI